MAPIQRAGLRGPPPATRLITRPFLRPGEQLPGDSGVCYTRPEAAQFFRQSGSPTEEAEMSTDIDAATVRRIAHLARVAVADDEVEHLRGEINAILSFVEQLQQVNVEGVEPMTSVM